jgi:hypothetical protein
VGKKKEIRRAIYSSLLILVPLGSLFLIARTQAVDSTRFSLPATRPLSQNTLLIGIEPSPSIKGALNQTIQCTRTKTNNVVYALTENVANMKENVEYGYAPSSSWGGLLWEMKHTTVPMLVRPATYDILCGRISPQITWNPPIIL